MRAMAIALCFVAAVVESVPEIWAKAKLIIDTRYRLRRLHHFALPPKGSLRRFL